MIDKEKSYIFVESTDGTDDGVERLVQAMEREGLPFFQSDAQPDGLIAGDDVVLLEINCQWAERGGTNTDLIREVIDAICKHPSGFTGEIIIADNGQAQYGSERTGGSLDWKAANSADRSQSVMDVIRLFQGIGFKVTGVLWDTFTTIRVKEYADGDDTDGFVVEDVVQQTGQEISYAKFSTEYGTKVSFKEGIWTGSAYDSSKLKVINMPVLKSHMLYQVTGAVKSYMGTVSDKLTEGRSHSSIAAGGMGSQMAGTRMPALNILDMIWVGPERGPGVSYDSAVQVNKIAASTDPVALDCWASKAVLIPEANKLPNGRGASMDPGGTEQGTFGYWLRLTVEELHKAGIHAIMDEAKMVIIE